MNGLRRKGGQTDWDKLYIKTWQVKKKPVRSKTYVALIWLPSISGSPSRFKQATIYIFQTT